SVFDATVLTVTESPRPPVATVRRVKLGDTSRALQPADPTATTRAVLAELTAVDAGEHTVIQIMLGPSRSPRALSGTGLPARRSSWVTVWSFIGAERDRERSAAARAKLAEHGFAATVRIGVSAATATRRQSLLLSVMGAMATAEAPDTRVTITAERAGVLGR